MKLTADPYKKEKIYNEVLQDITGVKFTTREIDIMSCILHYRQEKKIAALLSISPKTVNTHVYNIMNKLGYNSRDLIIDFIEKSGKMQYLKQYYFCLTIEDLFETSLKKIAKILNRDGVVCKVIIDETVDKQNILLSNITQYLQLANIKLDFDNQANASSNITIKIDDAYNNDKANIILLLHNIENKMNDQIIDFSNVDNFYDAAFKLIKRIVSRTEIEHIIQEFNSQYENIQQSWGNFTPIPSENFKAQIQVKIIKKYFLIPIIGFILLGIIIFNLINKPDIVKINQQIAEFVKVFSTDNITSDQRIQTNYSLLEKAEAVIQQTTQKNIADYYLSKHLSESELMNYLYMTYSLAAQYVYSQHNGLKARELLLHAKTITHQYIKNKYHHNDIKTDFNTMSNEEIYTELTIVKHLPEMHARLLYLLGRTYIYDGDINISVKYFESAKYLGNKTGIFEGYLSIRNGLEFVRNKVIEDYIENGKHKSAVAELKETIAVNWQLLNDSNEYKINYNPHILNQEIIIPKNDLFSQFSCMEFISKHIAKLLIITNNENEKKHYLQEIEELYIGGNNNPALLDASDKINNRRAASIYNNLGNILLKLYVNNIDFTKFKQQLIKKLELDNIDELNLIEAIFILAKDKSRNNEYLKADSYDGLVRLCEQKLLQNIVSKEEKIRLKKQIEFYISKRDEINKALGRTDWRLNKHKL